MKKLISYVLMIVMLAVATAAPSCAPKDVLRNSIKASYLLPGSTNDLIAVIEKGVAQNVFTPAEGRTWGGAILPVAESEVQFVALVRAADTIFDRLEALKAKKDPTADDKAQIQTLTTDLGTQKISLQTFLDGRIAGPLLTVFQMFHLLTGAQKEFILLALTAVRTLIMSIGRGLGSAIVSELPKLVSAAARAEGGLSYA